MSEEQPDAEGPPDKTQSLRGRVSSGMVWLTIDSTSSMAIVSIVQLVLTVLLIPADFGLIALARTVVAFGNIVERSGLHTLLVQRQAEFRRWATPVFWLCVSLGCISPILIMAAAPFAAWAYGEPKIVPLLAVLAIAPVIDGFGTTGHASLLNSLRFRTLALIMMTAVLVSYSLMIILAWWGFGVYSFAIPAPIASFIRTSLMLWFGRPPIRLTPAFHEWPRIVTDAWHLFTSNVALTLTTNIDKILLGVFQPTRIVGYYAFALMLSLANFRLFGKSLDNVLVPSLSQIQDHPKRTIAAYLRAANVLTIVGTPMCWILAACAKPLVEIIDPVKWGGAVPVLQILALAMSARIAYYSSASLIKAQGRFRLLQRLTIAYGVLFAAAVAVGASRGAAVGAALAYGGCAVAFGPMIVLLAIGPSWSSAREVAQLFVRPAILSAAAVVPAMLVARLVPASWIWQPVWQIITVVLVTGILYFAVAMMFARTECRLFFEQLGQILGRLWGIVRAARGTVNTPGA